MTTGTGLANPSCDQIQLDLHHLLGMQSLGYNVLRYFRLSQNNAHKASMGTKEQMVQGVAEIKALVNSSYQYYSAQEDVQELLRCANPFYECFLD